MIKTVWGYFEGFTKREVEKNNLSYKAQTIIGYPSEKEYLQMMININGIENYAVSSTDITNAHVICVPDLAGLRG